MMLNVSVLGASGRMGRSLLSCIAEDKNLRLVGALTESSDPALGQDAGVSAGLGSLDVSLLDCLLYTSDAADE